MTKIKLGILSFGIVFALVACTENAPQNTGANNNTAILTSNTNTQPTPEPTKADMMADAKALYEENCSVCHQASGDGGPMTSGKKKINVPSLKKGKAVSATDEQLAHVIAEGDGPMPPFKDGLTPEQIKSLVQLVRKEFQGGGAMK